MKLAIVGGGIAGLTLALNLHKLGIDSTVFEAVADVREIGVGITLLPHGMRELTLLGLDAEVRAAGIETTDSLFFNRFGQRIYAEPRGVFAGYKYPEMAIHRGRLHRILFEAARDRLGADNIITGRRCIGLDQDQGSVELGFLAPDGSALSSSRYNIVVGCDGVNSIVRRSFYPNEPMVYSGINMWRGVTRHKPLLNGRSYMRIGSIKTGKMVIYPIIDNVDGQGNQLINWVAEAYSDTSRHNDWNRTGNVEDFISIYKDWVYDWLDVPALIRNAAEILEYPMADREPLPRWTFGRVTLMGDAAHPMYPRGSTGSSQAMIDARTFAECLAAETDPVAALTAYESQRREKTGKIVLTNRTTPPDYINIYVDELTGDRPFADLDQFVSQADLRALSDQYKRMAGYALDDLR